MWEVRQGDCLQLMAGMAENSVDVVITDPPYGIGFMGKQWDQALPNPAVWREALRVLKPGGSAAVMSGSRLDCLWRMCRDLEAAGFELSQTALYWVYRSGFPKGGDLSKMADAAVGAEREVVGSNPNHRDVAVGGQYGTVPMLNLCSHGDITAPASPLAVALDGWFTKGKVKPAVEVIIWARKPISERTELANMARWGVGGVNCGKCMVPFGEGGQWTDHVATGLATDKFFTSGETPEIEKVANPAGRFPANLLCMDEALGEGSRYFDVDAWAAEHGYTEDGWADAAAAGLLQVAKPSRGEKNAGCEGFPAMPSNFDIGRRKCTACGAWEWRSGQPDLRRCNCPNPDWVEVKPHHSNTNPHPTCKPVRLMAYLADFLCPAGGTILDPFCGSGTTGVAAVQSGRDFIGCELEAEYVGIAEARIAHAAQARDPQLTLTG